MDYDYTLETLLDLNGMIMEVGQGLWVKMNAPADHKHKGERIIRYIYQNAEQLLADFWKDVDLILKKRIH